jgi:D-glycero-alpha-D-manno-heptose-7-phosphate kinase
MIISRTPLRVSFFGGGTDLPSFFRAHGGSVLSATIDKYTYVSVRRLPPFFEYRNEAIYSVIERTTNPNELKHPLIKEAMMMVSAKDLRISYDADLPARSGLGTSSSFAVGLLNALHRLAGRSVGPQQLAEESIHLERVRCDEAGGWQDQIASAFGGFNRIDFSEEGFSVHPIAASRDRLEALARNLMLFFTGITRSSSAVQNELERSLPSKKGELHRMAKMVKTAEDILTSDTDLDCFGSLLDETWRIKRCLSGAVTTGHVDECYETAIRAGARGGKLLGGGGGGFLLFYVPSERQHQVRQALAGMLCVPIGFEYSGTTILYPPQPASETAAVANAAEV